jgi:hypothetical protein
MAYAMSDVVSKEDKEECCDEFMYFSLNGAVM